MFLGDRGKKMAPNFQHYNAKNCRHRKEGVNSKHRKNTDVLNGHPILVQKLNRNNKLIEVTFIR